MVTDAPKRATVMVSTVVSSRVSSLAPAVASTVVVRVNAASSQPIDAPSPIVSTLVWPRWLQSSRPATNHGPLSV